MKRPIVFFDTEVGVSDEKIYDIGAVSEDSSTLHSSSVSDFLSFIDKDVILCGHNIIHHDLKYIEKTISKPIVLPAIDTLYLSPLLFPKRPYHSLLKDDKLQTDELNNPVNDSKKAMRLFYDEVNAYNELSRELKGIYRDLLSDTVEFRGFFSYVSTIIFNYDTHTLIRSYFRDKICINADLQPFINNNPIELAYALALIETSDHQSITPPWLLYNFPQIENIIRCLTNTPCQEGCPYCKSKLDIHKKLKEFFGYDEFRKYNGEPLQENAAQAAVDGKSLLAVFPTGGGKSITFQLPALIAGAAAHALTIVISPLQSLMKDQVDNLNQIGINEAVTINGLLDPIERANSIERLMNGSATLLYISPEQLRSKTIEKILISRNIARFVIDEAHCFSAWGQDFRVDYLYIGDFIRHLQKLKNNALHIPVSCFTATAKQKVISDICDYFKRKLDVNLELFASTATRENLHYTVLHQDTDEEKYNTLRNLIAEKDCPTIVYVSRTKRTKELSDRLTADGFPARPFNGKMESNDKIENQEAFIRNEVKVIVATSAFGMGVDKKDVKLVIHYDISDSLENYVQEAGRAGRDPNMQADCYVLYNDSDLDKHFILLNQTKLSISEIQQVWKAVKTLTRFRSNVCCSALEIARQAGWDDSVNDVETRVKTAISALESAGYVKRGRNVPHVYATSIQAKNMIEAAYRIDQSPLFSDKQRTDAKRIIKSLISSRSIAKAGNDEAESRVDYLADTLGLEKAEVIGVINLMRQDGLLSDTKDMSAYIYGSDTENKSKQILKKFSQLEQYLLNHITDSGCEFSLKELNDKAIKEGLSDSSIKNIRTLIYFLIIKNYIIKNGGEGSRSYQLAAAFPSDKMIAKYQRRIELCHFILEYLYQNCESGKPNKEEKAVQFSVIELLDEYKNNLTLDNTRSHTSVADIEDALLYLSKIGALKLEGGFLVLYNGMEIKRLVTDNKIRYKVDDYRFLDEFYKQKIRQIHIIGEYANLMVKNYNAALQFVQDYFQMDFKKFIAKYFKGERIKEIDRNITPEKYHQLFGTLSDIQSKIINDADSKYIVVAAGPGSGKTRVLVHKLASLLLLEDVKHEQLLMLTFSRAAATEFKKRLIELIGNAANFVEIKTFHSYCFDLLGKIGSLDGVENAVKDAAKMIENGDVEQGKIIKNVLVIDEAQDMDENEYRLIKALIRQNDDMRVIAVGDDDQNIYQFRGSDSKYMRSLIEELGAVKYEMNENYRSGSEIVTLSNAFAVSINNRMKTEPIVSVTDYHAAVSVVRHQSRYMYDAIVNHIESHYPTGSACILTLTNDEALQIQGLLTKRGIKSKLIQSMDRFRLCNLAEVRHILKIIEGQLHSPVISDETWEYAKARLSSIYADSGCLENILNLMHEFQTVFPVKYYSDFKEFINESNYEDFYTEERNTIYVSTIHKSKGREFDTIYIMLRDSHAVTDEEKRKLYVGMTRAKKNLFIYCNTDLFSQYTVPGVNFLSDNNNYPEPTEITLQMGFKDVFLDFFADKKNLIFNLHSGMSLDVESGYLSVVIKDKRHRVLQYSKAFKDKLIRLKEKGYIPCSATVRFIVAWKNEKHEEELPIVLADVAFKKTQ